VTIKTAYTIANFKVYRQLALTSLYTHAFHASINFQYKGLH